MSPVNTRVQEPSMEEILASIRRIIADDQDRVLPARFGSASNRSPAVKSFAPPADQDGRDIAEEDVGEEDADETGEPADAAETQAEAAVAVPATEEAAGPDAEIEAAPAQEPPPPAQAAHPEPDPPELGATEPLVSGPADAAAGHAFQRLAATVRPRPALTMEEHVTEMLRPMLRAWLDENLPPLVERLVQAEIERISRGR